MMSSSMNSANNADSTSKWRSSNGLGQPNASPAAMGDVLFGSLFSADFFSSEVQPSQKAAIVAPTTIQAPSREVRIKPDSDPDSDSGESAEGSTSEEEKVDFDRLMFCGTRSGHDEPELLKKLKAIKDESEQEDKTASEIAAQTQAAQQAPVSITPVESVTNKETEQATTEIQATVAATSSIDDSVLKVEASTPTTNEDLQPSPKSDNKVVQATFEEHVSIAPIDAKSERGVEGKKKSQATNENVATEDVHSEKLELTESDSKIAKDRHETKELPSLAPRSVQQNESANGEDSNEERGQNRRAERLEDNRSGKVESSNESTAISANENAVLEQAASVEQASWTQPTDVSSIIQTSTPVDPAQGTGPTAIVTLTDTPNISLMHGSAMVGSASSPNPVTLSASKTPTSTTEPIAAVTNNVAGVSPAGTVGQDSSTHARSSAPRASAPVAAEHSLTDYQRSRLLQRVLNGMERLGEDSSVVRLRLHPPELGSLQMSLHMKQQQLSANIVVDSEMSRQVLQENLPQLQSKLAEQGITVERFDIQLQGSVGTDAGAMYDQQQSGFSGGGWNSQSGQGRQFGEARYNQIRQENVERAETQQISSSMSRYYSGQNLNLRA